MAFVYILQSKSGKYYIGSTTDLKERIKHHQGGHTPSTKRLGEMSLVLEQKYDTLTQARRVEQKLKKLKRKDYIRRIVEEGHINMSA